jgi:tetratricopeptide (TPR) repeat protein
MTQVRRLTAVGVALALAAVCTYTQVWGDPARSKGARDRDDGSAPAKAEQSVAADLAVSKFLHTPVVTYKDKDGVINAGVQVKPKIAETARRPRDFVLLVDTTAAQAKGGLSTATKVVESFIEKAAATDRISLWTYDIKPKDLSRGFKKKDELKDAIKVLRAEYGCGDSNLKKALTDVVASYEQKKDRQRILLYFGDGMSVGNPITDKDRRDLCNDMVKKEVAFFPVPVGIQPDPQNLHGFATGTGGIAIRLHVGDQIDTFLKLIDTTVSAPILYPESFAMSKNVVESLPTKLPPLRADSSTLVVGRVKGGDEIGYTIKGTVAGKSVTVNATEKLPEPESDNFFLVGMIEQWRNAKDQPGLLPGDRVLGASHTQGMLAKEDLRAQADMALHANKLEAADRLFDQLMKLDSTDREAPAGKLVVDKMRKGELNLDDLRKRVDKADENVTRIVKGKDGKFKRQRVNLRQLANEQPQPKPGPEVDDDPLIKDAKRRAAIEDQRATKQIEEAIRQAGQILRHDPEGAHEFLKRALDGVRTNPDLTDKAKQALEARLVRTLRQNDVEGRRYQRILDQQLAALAREQERLRVGLVKQSNEDRIRERLRVFHNLMDQAREEEATLRAQDLRQDLIDEGVQVPPAVTAAYRQALTGHHIRELRELRRISEQRWMLTLMQVDRSHMPFPDEPPVQFPPAATWKKLTEMRKARYESSGFGAETPKRLIQLRNRLGDIVDFEGFDDPKLTLEGALEYLNDRYELNFEVLEPAFRDAGYAEKSVLDEPIATKPIPKMFKVTLAAVLRKILSRITTPPGHEATYLIRRDHIEITTANFATAEKSVRVYPVADLVIPIPNSVNTQSVTNQATLFGFGGAQGTFGGFGQFGAGGLGALGALGALGGGLQFGALGALGGGLQLGAIGALGGGLQLGAIGALGGGLQLGALGALGAVGQLGVAGQAGFGGMQGGFGGQGFIGGGMNLGGMGQLGQFGNLGGQFGLQGGTQDQILILLIRQVVGTPKDWMPLGAFQQIGIPQQPGGNEELGNNPEGNAVGFFPPAMALVVKGTSRIHLRSQSPLTAPGAVPPQNVNMLDKKDPVEIVRNGDDGKVPPKKKTVVAGGGKGEDDDTKIGKKPELKKDADPKVIWQDALARGVDDPALIIACSDYMAMCREWGHAAEFLKANLRLGIVVKPWVYEALALALKESKASPEEVERAETSLVSLQPLDAQGFLKAARAMSDMERFDRAVAFCRQAALLEPNTPHAYSDALVYAQRAKDQSGIEWAAGNLSKRDWPINNQEYQLKATRGVKDLAKQLDTEKRQAEKERLLAQMTKKRERDLVIKLRWSGEADLDLKVLEPSGSTCSCLNRQTIGGGTLVGDTLGEPNSETYIAAEAFSGEYRISVDRIWGRPLGEKAQVEIIRHQGTARERSRVETIDLRLGAPLVFKFDEGRRTSAAYVAPPEAARRPETQSAPVNTTLDLMRQLRQLADPIVTGAETKVRGGAGSFGSSVSRRSSRDPERSGADRLAYQTRVDPFVDNSSDLTAQAVISADRTSVRLSLNASFTMVGNTALRPVVVNPLVPGGFKPSGLQH